MITYFLCLKKHKTSTNISKSSTTSMINAKNNLTNLTLHFPLWTQILLISTMVHTWASTKRSLVVKWCKTCSLATWWIQFMFTKRDMSTHKVIFSFRLTEISWIVPQIWGLPIHRLPVTIYSSSWMSCAKWMTNLHAS